MKFSALDDNKNPIFFEYGNLYYREALTSGFRLTVGPSSNHVKLLDELAKIWETDQYYALYVSLISHTGRKQGRYQSPVLSKYIDLRQFLYTFQEFFEGDGRHHVWVASPVGTLVYDQHNVIYAYGDLDKYQEILEQNDFDEERFCFPSPHMHSYNSELTSLENDLFSYWDWIYSPLHDEDEYQ